MKTITLKKPDGTKFQVHDRRGEKRKVNFQTFKTGYTINKEPEPLLPTGVELEEDDVDDVQTNKKQKVEPLYPLGIEIEE